MRTTKADYRRVLEILATIPSAYHSQGPGVVIQEIEHTLQQALSGKFAGISRKA